MSETKNNKAAAPTVEELQSQLAAETAAREEAEKAAEILNAKLAEAESKKPEPKGTLQIGKKKYKVVTPLFTLPKLGTFNVADLKKAENKEVLELVLSGKYNILQEIEKEADNG
jgi:hypothetical protein